MPRGDALGKLGRVPGVSVDLANLSVVRHGPAAKIASPSLAQLIDLGACLQTGVRPVSVTVRSR